MPRTPAPLRENERLAISYGFSRGHGRAAGVILERHSFVSRCPDDGFTLIELLIGVTILAILAAIAYPSYRTQVENTRRAEMQSELMSLTVCLERKHAELSVYSTKAAAECRLTDTPLESANGYYSIAFVDGTLGASTYLLKATPKGSQSDNGALFIDQAQRRYWDENNDGDTDDPGENNWKRE
jgi:type IV pilus assembly protein PilE